MCGRMIVKVNGVSYYHQFSSQEDGWEFVVAHDIYQDLGAQESAREVRPTDPVVTVTPNDLMASLPHHRMPAVLLGSSLGAWLEPRTPDPERCL